ncbi:MAG: acetate--CoA ligase family protein [Actinomycetales bacterium]
MSAEAVRDAGTAVRTMLEARSVALVGASPRPGSFGARMVAEVGRSRPPLDLHLVNPRYREVGGRPCVPQLTDIADPVDLVLLGVPDAALENQLGLAAERGDRSAVIFGSVVGPSLLQPGLSMRSAVTEVARAAGLAVCGGGCMGFVNLVSGVRAIGYVEREELPAGPVALVSHSGSAFSALLRSHRRIGYTVAVSSGQELATTAADYVDYALELPETRVVALLLETMRMPDRLRAALARAAAHDVPVVALTVGTSGPGAAMVAAHSGALAGGDGAWEALFDAYGVLRVGDLDELADTLELFGAGRRARPGTSGVATVHDSGAERAMVVDLADELAVTFADLSPSTVDRLTALLDPGLLPTNPLDVWGTGADTRRLFGDCLRVMADDPGVAAVALAVDLVPEFDGDRSYPLAVQDAWAATDVPVAVLSTMHSAVDQEVAAGLRAQGIPVLEGGRSGLVALGNLAAYADRRASPEAQAAVVDPARQARWLDVLGRGHFDGTTGFALLRDYGVPAVEVRAVTSAAEAATAAEALGWPVVLKTDEPGIEHKSDVGGVVLGLATAQAVAAAYADLAQRLGPRVLVSASAPAGVELALGLVRDPLLGPLVLVAAGGVLVELVDDRAVALPPVSETVARRAISRLRVNRLLQGFRGAAPADVGSVVTAVRGLSQLAVELGDAVDALDVNPLIAGPAGALAADILVEPRRTH